MKTHSCPMGGGGVVEVVEVVEVYLQNKYTKTLHTRTLATVGSGKENIFLKT